MDVSVLGHLLAGLEAWETAALVFGGAVQPTRTFQISTYLKMKAIGTLHLFEKAPNNSLPNVPEALKKAL